MGILQKTGNFLGVKKFADAMASTARVFTGEVAADRKLQEQDSNNLQKITYAMKNEKDPAKKQRLANLAKSLMNNPTPTAEQIDPGLKLSNKEIIGSAANVVLNMATPGAFKGGKAAVIGKNAALGSAFGAASGLEKNRNASGVVGSTVGGAIIGGGVGVAGLAAKGVKNYFTKTTPEWLMNKAIKPALQDLKKNVKYGSKTLSQELLEEGVKGGPKKLLDMAEKKSASLEDDLQNTLTHQGLSEARINKQQIKPYLEDIIKTKKGIPGLGEDADKITEIWQSMPDEMTLLEANGMKRRIYGELRDVSYKLDAKLGVKAAALKQIARGLKTEIENTVGGTVVSDINRKLSIYGRLENAMVDQVARDMRNNGLSLTDAILASGGAMTNPATFIAALGGIGIRKNMPAVGTYAAQGLNKVGKVLEGNAVQGSKAILKKATLNLP